MSISGMLRSLPAGCSNRPPFSPSAPHRSRHAHARSSFTSTATDRRQDSTAHALLCRAQREHVPLPRLPLSRHRRVLSGSRSAPESCNKTGVPPTTGLICADENGTRTRAASGTARGAATVIGLATVAPWGCNPARPCPPGPRHLDFAVPALGQRS
ncbi:hypothetical protein L226DRAFT_61974 [Lentinus tigrinus ALCF2SS1-7]|uniref:uncharacterized protein n=1 Tax=Lentinus tigrinus ALCF2SS1-7 TaxID=1328758 RepID=UPI0011661CD9|nr:hypothetical protein L226DRAFT_61974 [Lentinus tigrinus ALCF2SS1-7]